MPYWIVVAEVSETPTLGKIYICHLKKTVCFGGLIRLFEVNTYEVNIPFKKAYVVISAR